MSDLGLWGMVVIISLVGVLTKLVYFEIGKGGRSFILEHVPKLEPDRLAEIELNYQNHGSPMLLLTSIPGLGSAIAATAGLLRTSLVTFIILVLLSNFIRNSLLVLLFGQGVAFLTGGS